MKAADRYWWIIWLFGLFVFALLRIPHGPLAIPEVPGGIFDHQAAGTAAEVNRIQQAWSDAGLLGHARWGMIGDFLFIGLYGLGSVLGGVSFRQAGSGFLRVAGLLVAVAGAIFLFTDYAETIAQFFQLTSMQGDDGLASLAATMQPIKMVAFGVSFLGTLALLVIRRMKARAG